MISNVLYRQIIRFLSCGAIATLVHWIVFFILAMGLLMPTVTPLLATTIGAAAGAIVNFFLQHRVVFATKASYLKTATPYGLSLMLGFALNALCFVLLMQLNVFPLGLVQVLSSACVTVFNFIFYKKVVFYGSQTTHSA